MSDGPISLANLPEAVDDWDKYFLCIAATASIKSKDPRCQVGAVIVSKDQMVLSTGFNGFARGINDGHIAGRCAGEAESDLPRRGKFHP